MKRDIKIKVESWLFEKIRSGKKVFDIKECTKDIGLNPEEKCDIKAVDEVFEGLEHGLNQIILPSSEYNN